MILIAWLLLPVLILLSAAKKNDNHDSPADFRRGFSRAYCPYNAPQLRALYPTRPATPAGLFAPSGGCCGDIHGGNISSRRPPKPANRIFRV